MQKPTKFKLKYPISANKIVYESIYLKKYKQTNILGLVLLPKNQNPINYLVITINDQRLSSTEIMLNVADQTINDLKLNLIANHIITPIYHRKLNLDQQSYPIYYCPLQSTTGI